MSWDIVEALVLRAQAGESKAFDQLVVRFQGAVYAKALKCVGDPASAEELTQDVFVHAFRKLAQLQHPRALAGWLRKMTVRMAMNRHSARRAMSGLDSEVFDAVESRPAPGPTEAMEAGEDRVRLREAMTQLKPLDRQTLVAHYFDGHSIEAMAEIFDAPEGTIKRRLFTARKRLAEIMEPLGV